MIGAFAYLTPSKSLMLGIFTFTPLGITGAILQSVNHGISTGMLFFLVGMLYDRRHTRDIVAFGGIKRAVPVLSAFFLIAIGFMVATLLVPLMRKAVVPGGAPNAAPADAH